VTSFWRWPLLFATGLAAGFVDSVAGGGGLITLPVLMSLGLAPQEALGTNKLQATFGSASAAAHYAHAKTVSLKDCARGFICTLIGAAAGALTVQQINAEFLRKAIPVLLILVALYVLFRPRFGTTDALPRMSRAWFDILFGGLLGFYDGFFGPGTGTFWAVACVVGLGFNLTRATGYTKVMNFASNVSSLVLFLAARRADLPIGITMGIGQLVGARVGSRMVIAHGATFIRPVFLAVVLLLAIKLLFQAYAN
jgi:uncharacterized membrane protein YfcA